MVMGRTMTEKRGQLPYLQKAGQTRHNPTCCAAVPLVCCCEHKHTISHSSSKLPHSVSQILNATKEDWYITNRGSSTYWLSQDTAWVTGLVLESHITYIIRITHLHLHMPAQLTNAHQLLPEHMYTIGQQLACCPGGMPSAQSQRMCVLVALLSRMAAVARHLLHYLASTIWSAQKPAGQQTAGQVKRSADLIGRLVTVLLLVTLCMLAPDSISQHSSHSCTKKGLTLRQLITLLRQSRETQDSTQTQHLHHALATEV
jgi:hypothetical protein